ncbi:MAG: Crp/Fnr family transcriptional regulator [Terriglobales bacterium]
MKAALLGKQYRDGEMVCHQGELGSCMYIVQFGAVELIRRDNENEFCLGVVGTGDSFGEAALLELELRPFTARAVGETVVLSVDGRAFLSRIHEDASFALNIIRKMSRRIRDLEAALIRSTDLSQVAALAGSAAKAKPAGPAAK